MVEVSTSKADQAANPYKAVNSIFEQLHPLVRGSILGIVVSQLPIPEKQQEIVLANADKKARFTTEVLGLEQAWSDATMYLHIGAVKDAAKDVGLTPEQLYSAYPLVQQLTYALQDYIDYLVGDLLEDDLGFLASKLQSTGEAFGFNRLILRRLRKQGRDETADVHITFADGISPPLENKADGWDANRYLEESPRGTIVNSSNYDPATNRLDLRLSSPA